MATYIAFIASLNLCIGYALGVYIGVLPGFSPRRDTELDDDPIQLGTPEPVVTPGATVQATAPSDMSARQIDVAQAHTAVGETEVVEPVSTDVRASTTGVGKADYEYLLDGLADFKSKIDAVSVKLRETTGNRESIDECAGSLKQANNDYLERADEALESLRDGGSTAATEVQRQLQQTLSKQSANVRVSIDEIDDIIAEEDSETARERLIASSEQLSSEAADVEQATHEVQDANVGVRQDGTAQTVEGDSAEKLNELLDEMSDYLEEQGESSPLQVAALSLTDATDVRGEVAQRLIAGLQEVVAAELTEGQSMAVDPTGRVLILLPGDNHGNATARCERIRQCIEATRFQTADDELQAAVYCAVATSAAASDRDEVIRRLTESLDEAGKLPESRTFHHDGKIAAPVPPQLLDITPTAVQI